MPKAEGKHTQFERKKVCRPAGWEAEVNGVKQACWCGKPWCDYHEDGNHEDTWEQYINIWSSCALFPKTGVEIESNMPLRDTFKDFCKANHLDRDKVVFVWQDKGPRGGVRAVRLVDSDAPCDLGMKECNDEDVECQYM